MRWLQLRRLAGVATLTSTMLAGAGPFGTGPALSSSAGAQSQCQASIDGIDTQTTSRDHPLSLTADSQVPLPVRVIAREGIRWAQVSLLVGDLAIPVADFTVDPPETTWQEQLSLARLATIGVGLYEVRLKTDVCSAMIWVRVGGRSPLKTAAGAAAASFVGLGVLVTLIGLARARRRRGAFPSVLGAALAGGAALLLTQQFGILPMTGLSLAAWTSLPGALGGLTNAALRYRAPSTAPGSPESSALPDDVPTPDAEPPTGPGRAAHRR